MNTVIFDMDGVLINSEPVIIKAATRALANIGITATRDFFEPFIGAGEEFFIIGPCKDAGIPEKADAVMTAMYQNYNDTVYQELQVYPQGAETIRALHDAGYTLALVSSSAREKLLISLDAAKIPAEYFDLILSGNDVTKKKPDPEPYVKAAEKLGKDPKDCLVIEDALNGIKAAKAAGMHCGAVTTSFPKSALLDAGADMILQGLGDILNVIK